MIVAAFVLSGYWDVVGHRTEISQFKYFGSAVLAALEALVEITLVASLFS